MAIPVDQAELKVNVGTDDYVASYFGYPDADTLEAAVHTAAAKLDLSADVLVILDDHLKGEARNGVTNVPGNWNKDVAKSYSVLLALMSVTSPSGEAAATSFGSVLGDSSEWGFNWKVVLPLVVAAAGGHKAAQGAFMFSVVAGTRSAEESASRYTKSQWESFHREFPSVPVTMFSRRVLNVHGFTASGMVASMAPICAAKLIDTKEQLSGVMGTQFGLNPLAYHFWASGIRKSDDPQENAKLHVIHVIGNIAITSLISKNLREQHKIGRLHDRRVLYPREDIMQAVAGALITPVDRAPLVYAFFRDTMADTWANLKYYPDALRPMLDAVDVDLAGKVPIRAIDMAVVADVGMLRIGDMFTARFEDVYEEHSDQISRLGETLFTAYTNNSGATA